MITLNIESKMQINAYNNLFSPMSADVKSGAPIDKNVPSKAAIQAAELGKAFAPILEMALAEPDGRDAVARARQALADGSLENQQSLEAAADNLLTFGY